MHLCVGFEAADYPHKALNFDKVHCVNAHPCKGVLGIPTNILGPLRARYPYLSQGTRLTVSALR